MKFYDSNWQLVTTAAHGFKHLSAIAYDEFTDIIYFSDQETIFSLKLSEDETNSHRLENVVLRAGNESIEGLAFDPLDSVLYWTDSRSRKIYQKKLGVDDAATEWMVVTDDKKPNAIAIDVCRRRVYWTNFADTPQNSTIKRASMDRSKPETILDNNDIPRGVVVDQHSKRLFWVDDLHGHDYVVGSSALDGSNRREVYHGTDHEPANLAVDREFVYWTDSTSRKIWKVSKTVGGTPQSLPLDFSHKPNGIIVRQNLMTSQAENAECSKFIAGMKAKETDLVKEVTVPVTSAPQKPQHCERSLCYNFCVHGVCHFDSVGNPICTCPSGYKGARCEEDSCYGYCLNGRCSIVEDVPQCICESSFYGRRCEHMEMKELCNEYCETNQQPDGLDLARLCGK